ncbi:MAG: M4 family metallopeptidase, partial [Ferruginibacter sp.]
ASAKNTFEFASPTVTGTAATRYSGSVTIATRLVGGNYNLIASIATENYPLHTRNMNLGTKYAAATEFTDADNNWTAAEFNNATFDNAALDAHWGAAKVYDYWKTRHGRSSYNNAGAVINSYVHIKDSDPTNPDPTKYDNAYWDGTEMNYGDGSQVNGGFLPLTALDICGHEIGHAVCSNTANLTYNRESGAMNEGFSDIWGCSIEHFSDPHEVDAVAKSYWDIGEEIGLPLPTPLRSMANPKRYGQPDTYLGTNWQDATTAGCPTPAKNTNDYCGVHTNSGVLNHWFYLLVTGGSGLNDIGNSFSVPGIDWAEAELITFLAEKNMTSSANYAACRTATINAATTLYGACGLETEAVTRAWYAVGVGADFVPCTPQISFAGTATVVSETAAAPGCGASKTISIPLKISAAATGGNATATVNVSSGTATNGVDYSLNNSTVTFAANSTSNQNIVLTIYDDGDIEPTENIVVHLAAVAANGSNATKANVFLDYTVSITDDDKVEDNGGTETHIVGANTTALNNTSPFHSISRSARTQYIIPAADLLASGLRANIPITNLSVKVTTKGSTAAFTGYTIAMTNTAATDVTSSYVTGLTQVYTGDYTTSVGVNNFPLSPTFSWDGTSNLAVQVCFANASAGTANDGTDGYIGTSTGSTIWVAANNGTGCTLAFSATNNTSYTPVFTLTQSVTPTAIESTLATTRDWTVNEANSTVNFYATADGKLIAKVKNNTAALGCVNAQLVDAGNTWQSFLGGSRSQKAIKITPTTN